MNFNKIITKIINNKKIISVLLLLCFLTETLWLPYFLLPYNISAYNASQAKICPQDDFYGFVNEEWIKTAKIPSGKASNGTFYEVSDLNENRILNILKDLSSKQNKEGTAEQKLADLYKSALDIKSCSEKGILPIKTYLNEYETAKNLKELFEADIFTYRETGCSYLMTFGTSPDAKNSNKNILCLNGLTNHFSKHIFEKEETTKAFEKFLFTLLKLSGSNNERALLDVKKIVELEKTLAGVSLETYELYDINKIYNIFQVGELDKLYPNMNISLYLKDAGYDAGGCAWITETKKFEKSAEYFTEESLEVLKLYIKIRMLIQYGNFLSQEFIDATNVFNKSVLGVQGSLTAEQRAVNAVKFSLSDDMGRIYIKNYFSEKAKKDIENMISKIKEQYKKKIRNSHWMSKVTQERSIKKLETMGIKVGYPDKWSDNLKEVQIKSSKNGGSYFSNICEIQKKFAKLDKQKLEKSVDKTEWIMPVYVVNACYSSQRNEILFPAGILQAPFYDVNASEEQNMGGIGAIIAHEISHAFDSFGSKFDENGNAVNWWLDEDYASFEKLCEKFVDAYNGIEIIDGVVSNGQQTLFENIADVGAISCMLNILSENKKPDYKAFFESWAKVWKLVTTPQALKHSNSIDVHSFAKIRTNRTLANFEEFHKTFDIKENDKMYIAHEKRVSLW